MQLSLHHFYLCMVGTVHWRKKLRIWVQLLYGSSSLLPRLPKRELRAVLHFLWRSVMFWSPCSMTTARHSVPLKNLVCATLSVTPLNHSNLIKISLELLRFDGLWGGCSHPICCWKQFAGARGALRRLRSTAVCSYKRKKISLQYHVQKCMLHNDDGIFPPPFSNTVMCRTAGLGACPEMSSRTKAKSSMARKVHLPFNSTCSEKTLRHLLLAIHLHSLGFAGIPQTCWCAS